jgi:hypothetical protein
MDTKKTLTNYREVLVDKEGVCKNCGHYALQEKTYKHLVIKEEVESEKEA